ncbi:MAG: hypothetical protein JSS95_10500 [Acidobacteria bacterium]|nr:hypothetical protein [Acidobacteriota bacterium]
MSKVKSPQDKKLASLKKDGRNMYGENDKSSRKNIPRSKQRQHQTERRPMKDALVLVTKAKDSEEIDDLAFAAESATIAKRRKGFAKVPDASLGEALWWKRENNSSNMHMNKKKLLVSMGKIVKV